MGWLYTSNVVLKPEAVKSESGDDNEKQEVPLELHRAELLGAAHILAEWPCQILRILLWVLLGAAFGILCALLLRLLIPILCSPATEPEHLHLVTSNLTAPRACALEALAREHSPQRTCHIVILRAHPPETLRLVSNLRETYPNLNAHYHPDPDDFFESSPLDGFFKFGAEGQGMLDLAARTLSLWRHGGVSVDLDNPIINLPPSGQYVQQGKGALLQFPEPCHPALQSLLSTLGSVNDQDSAEEAVERATNLICRTEGEGSPQPEQCLGVKVLGKEGICDNKNLMCPIVQEHHDITTKPPKDANTPNTKSSP